jgi:cytochrome c556
VFRADFPVQEVMESIIDPNADYIWDSVSTTVGVKGIVEKEPKTDEEWAAVRRASITIMEASNLLKIQGRKAARPGTKSIAPGVEEEPEAIEKLIAADPAGWNKAADGLWEAAAILMKAAEAKDKEKILDAGNTLDEACEGCHLKFWYPNQTEILKRNAAEAAKEAVQEVGTKAGKK